MNSSAVGVSQSDRRRYPKARGDTVSTIAHPAVLADALRLSRLGARTRTAALVVGFALLTALLAQLRVALPGTPVPVTGQTLGVLLAGAALGSGLGASSQGLYVLLGLVAPVYTGGEQGWKYFTGVTGGYLVGMIIAAFVVGLLAERHNDRHLLTAWPAMFFGSFVVYAFGVPWLAHVANIGTDRAIALGLTPFIVGDAAKALLAGAALPAAWRFVKHQTHS